MNVFTSVEKAQKAKAKSAYIAHKRGFLLYKTYGNEGTPMQFSVTSRVESANSLGVAEEGINLVNLKPLPFGLIARCITLFRKVYKEYGTEMIVLFRWNSERQCYYLDRPKFGCIGGAYLKYHQGGTVVGTIHSHGTMGAFFSGTDDKHEMEQPGIYLVAGQVTSNPPALVASIAGQGKRLRLNIPKVDPKYFDEEISDAEYEWWMEPLQVQSHIQGRQKGWYIVDSENDICFWTRRKKQAEELVEAGYEIVKAKRYKRSRANAFANATGRSPVSSYRGDSFDYDSYYGADRMPVKTQWEVGNKEILEKIIQKINQETLWQEFLEIAKDTMPQADFEDFLIQCAEHIEAEFPDKSGSNEEDLRLEDEENALVEADAESEQEDGDPPDEEEDEDGDDDETAEDDTEEEEEEEEEINSAPIGFGEHPGYDPIDDMPSWSC